MKPPHGYPADDSAFRSVLAHTWHQSRGTISLWTVYVCVGLFVAVAILDQIGLVSRQSSISVLGLSYVGIFRYCWLHQFFTAPLLHGGVVHLVFNMLSLWMLGPSVEAILGRGRYLLFSALCAASSMTGFLLFNWGTGNIVLGYSGVIFGILVAQGVFFPNNLIAIFAFFPLRMKYAVLILGAVELYLTISPEQGGIAHAAHLFGALSALIFLRGISWTHSAWAAMARLFRRPARRIIDGRKRGWRPLAWMTKKRTIKLPSATHRRYAPPKDIPWEL